VKLAEFKLTIDRSAEEIWGFMFDLKNVPKWDPGVVEARLTSEGPLEKVGATIETLGEGGSRRNIVRVTEFEMYRRLVLTFDPSKGPIGRATLTYTFEPNGNQTTLTRLVEGEFVGLWKLLAPVLGSRISKRVDEDSRQEAANIEGLFPPRN